MDHKQFTRGYVIALYHQGICYPIILYVNSGIFGHYGQKDQCFSVDQNLRILGPIKVDRKGI